MLSSAVDACLEEKFTDLDCVTDLESGSPQPDVFVSWRAFEGVVFLVPCKGQWRGAAAHRLSRSLVLVRCGRISQSPYVAAVVAKQVRHVIQRQRSL